MAEWTLNATRGSFIVDESPTANFDGSGLRTGVLTGPLIRRTLIGFDLSTIPDYKQLTNAWIILGVVQDGLLDVAANAYRITQAWTEAGVTWNKYDGSNNWTTAGGDYDTTYVAQWLQPRNPGTARIPLSSSNLDILNWVKDAIANRNNQLDLILKQSDETAVAGEYKYSDDESGAPPILHVQYVPRLDRYWEKGVMRGVLRGQK